MVVKGLGNYINGSFEQTKEIPLISKNPANNYEVLYSAHYNSADVEKALSAANDALPKWRALSLDKRLAYMDKLKKVFIKHQEKIAKAISLEMGKIFTESLIEAKGLSARIELTKNFGLSRVATEHLQGVNGETRYHPQGVLVILGPYNFPVHLMNSHIIPALLTGNTVVVKPSEITPLCGELYAKCVHEARLPKGVFNLLQGKGDIGQELVAHPCSDGVIFTGSYETGRAIKKATLDQPHKIVALEMGGKNTAVVLDDANMYQALSQIIQGAFLTSGQRCTATSRVLVHKKIAKKFIDQLLLSCKELKPGQPFCSKTVFGPLAHKEALKKYLSMIKHSEHKDCEVLLQEKTMSGGAFITPSLRLIHSSCNDFTKYLDAELFGPDIAMQIIDDLDHGLNILRKNSYGLSNSIFTAQKKHFEYFYLNSKSGLVNWNKSTNGASGMQPFGGLGKSGNQRAAGIDAVRYTTYPAAINYLNVDDDTVPNNIKSLLSGAKEFFSLSPQHLISRHKIEALLQRYKMTIDEAYLDKIRMPLNNFTELYLDKKAITAGLVGKKLGSWVSIDEHHILLTVAEKNNKQYEKLANFLSAIFNENYVHFLRREDNKINIPLDGQMPRSEKYLKRVYKDNFIPVEKKAVIDLDKSYGAYLVSVDDDPLSIVDSASQIASVGLGFNADAYQNALESNELNDSILSNIDIYTNANRQSEKHIDDYVHLLTSQANAPLKHASFTASGAEANEKAFDLCRVNSGGKKRIIAFEGSFHGRTIMSLHATYNKAKRLPFQFDGYETSFIPFPQNVDPSKEPNVSKTWIDSWSKGEIPAKSATDELLNSEIESLTKLRGEIAKGDVCAVIIEPMQCEGGDRYATKRFFNGLRAVTRELKTPLIFDEVQTGFCLSGPFFGYKNFQLKDKFGNDDYPDCITLGKKAQLGICLSVWQDSRPTTPHMVQVQRGLIQAKKLLKFNITTYEKKINLYLSELKNKFPKLILNPRSKGFAFAFDMPTAHIANQIINQRFYRGIMVYIAGEKTLRFRLNISQAEDILLQIFDALNKSLYDAADFIVEHGDNFAMLNEYISPKWINSAVSNENNKQSLNESDVKIVKIGVKDWGKVRKSIIALEKQSYEAERQDQLKHMHVWVNNKHCVVLVLYVKKEGQFNIAGYAFGGPLELCDIEACKEDAMHGVGNTFYSANVVVASEFRGMGLGLLLKKAQLKHVLEIKDDKGQDKYQYVTGRNRFARTKQIAKINKSFGAYIVANYNNQYGKTNVRADYYRINLKRPQIFVDDTKVSCSNDLIWSDNVQNPLGENPKVLRQALADGEFSSSVGSKLTLSNWTTPEVVRYAELLKSIAPANCQHAYFTSGRDEVVDKGIKALRYHKAQDVVLSFTGQKFGMISAAARSISDPSDMQKPFGYFDWPIISHPRSIGDKDCLKQIRCFLQKISSKRILAIVLQLISPMNGYSFSDYFLEQLNKIRTEFDIAIVFDETYSALNKTGKSFFMSDTLPCQPNMVWWYTGAQQGHVFCDDKYYVDKPLTLISTWDGDGISITRSYHFIEQALSLNVKQQAKYFAEKINTMPIKSFGEGFCQSLHFDSSQKAKRFIDLAFENNLLLSLGEKKCINVHPPINSTKEEVDRGVDVLLQCLKKVG